MAKSSKSSKVEEIVKKQNYVTFLSPGTIVSETTTKKIDKWDVKKAAKMAQTVGERHGATPYGFYFTTRGRKEDELDSKQLKSSSIYYLGGTVLTLKDVKARKSSEDKILISNMERNGYDRVIENTNSWKVTLPLNKTDKVLDFTPDKVSRR